MSSWLDVPMGGWSSSELLAVAAAALAAGFIRGFLGFGGALVIVMVLNVVLGPLAALPIAGLSGLPSTVQLLPTAVRLSDRAFVVPFGAASFVAAPMGTFILVSVEPALMKIAISVLVLALLGMLHRGWQFPAGTGPLGLACAGALTGIVQGSAGVGGPPAVAMALARADPPERQRANVIGVVTVLALCALIPMWYVGLFTREVVLTSLVIVPLYASSTWLGARYFSGRGRAHYRGAAMLALVAVAVVTLLIAIRGYLFP